MSVTWDSAFRKSTITSPWNVNINISNGHNRFLCAAFVIGDGDNISAVTLNGVAMTRLLFSIGTVPTVPSSVYLYGMLDNEIPAASGDYSLAPTIVGGATGGSSIVCLYHNVVQSLTLNASNTKKVTAGAANDGGLSITPTIDKSLICTFYTDSATGSGQTCTAPAVARDVPGFSGYFDSNGPMPPVATSWTITSGGSDTWNVLMWNLLPVLENEHYITRDKVIRTRVF